MNKCDVCGHQKNDVYKTSNKFMGRNEFVCNDCNDARSDVLIEDYNKVFEEYLFGEEI